MNTHIQFIGKERESGSLYSNHATHQELEPGCERALSIVGCGKLRYTMRRVGKGGGGSRRGIRRLRIFTIDLLGCEKALADPIGSQNLVYTLWEELARMM